MLDVPDDEEWGGRPEDGIWTDLRTSEARDLRAFVEHAKERALRAAEKAILRELTVAGVEFAKEHPNAPRGRQREEVPARAG